MLFRNFSKVIHPTILPRSQNSAVSLRSSIIRRKATSLPDNLSPSSKDKASTAHPTKPELKAPDTFSRIKAFPSHSYFSTYRDLPPYNLPDDWHDDPTYMEPFYKKMRDIQDEFGDDFDDPYPIAAHGSYSSQTALSTTIVGLGACQFSHTECLCWT